MHIEIQDDAEVGEEAGTFTIEGIGWGCVGVYLRDSEEEGVYWFTNVNEEIEERCQDGVVSMELDSGGDRLTYTLESTNDSFDDEGGVLDRN